MRSLRITGSEAARLSMIADLVVAGADCQKYVDSLSGKVREIAENIQSKDESDRRAKSYLDWARRRPSSYL